MVRIHHEEKVVRFFVVTGSTWCACDLFILLIDVMSTDALGSVSFGLTA